MLMLRSLGLQASTFVLLFGSTLQAYGTAAPGGTPPNGLCAGATVVALPLGSSVSVSGNNTNAPTDPIFMANLVWEAFTIPACADVLVSYCGTSPAFAGGLVYLATGCPMTNQVFNTGANIVPNACGDGNFAVRFPSLPAGTYYYPVLEAPGSSGNYTLVFSATACAATPPSNAWCSGAIALTSGTTCAPVSGTVEHATAAGNTGTACGNGDVADGVWYSFQATSTSHEIVVSPSAEFNVHLSLFSGDCTAPDLLGCAIGQTFGSTTTMAPTGLTVGATYHLRVADWYAGLPRTNTFELCVVSVASAQCDAVAGTLTATDPEVCYEGPTTAVSAIPAGNAVVPAGFTTAYLLVSAGNEVVMALGAQPTFEVASVGSYSIRTLVYDPSTFDTASIVLGSSTIGSLNEQFIQGGGSICASLDITGVGIVVQLCCPAEAGTLIASDTTVCSEEGGASLTASMGEPAVVPPGFAMVHLLSTAPLGTITGVSTTAAFSVGQLGMFAIHTLVYDSLTLSLDQIVVGTTTVAELNALLVAGGGSICAALDLAGAEVRVMLCCPGALGTLSLVEDTLCARTAGALVNWSVSDIVAPVGSDTLFLLAQAGAIIDTTSSTSFILQNIGAYTIHTLIHDSSTLDLGPFLEDGGTIAELNNALGQGGGTICALLATDGIPVAVVDCRPANDECASAIPVAVTLVQDCNNGLVQGDNTYATQGTMDAPGCGNGTSTYADVWYSVNTGDNTAISILFDPGTATSWGISVISACDATVELACAMQPAAPIDLSTTPDTDLLIRIFSDLNTGQGGAFSFCVTGASPTSICQGGQVSTMDDAASLVLCQDGLADVIDFATTSTASVDYSYVVADADSMIVALVAGNALDFNGLPVGTYFVHGISHHGPLVGIGVGQPRAGITCEGDCISLSDNVVEIMVEVCSGVAATTKDEWSIIPDASHGLLHLRSNGPSGAVQVQVFGPDGRWILDRVASMRSGESVAIPVPASTAFGTYVVRVVHADGVVTRRWLVGR